VHRRFVPGIRQDGCDQFVSRQLSPSSSAAIDNKYRWVWRFFVDETAQNVTKFRLRLLCSSTRVGARQLTYIETIALTRRADLARGPGTPRSYVAT
jgi:hypothetical protein